MATRGDGAAIIDLYANRWTDFQMPVTINNDLTGATFEAQVRAVADAPALVETFAISTPDITAGVTTFNLSLTEAEMAAMPDAPIMGDNHTLYWDLKMTLGGVSRVLFAGRFIVIAGVTQ